MAPKLNPNFNATPPASAAEGQGALETRRQRWCKGLFKCYLLPEPSSGQGREARGGGAREWGGGGLEGGRVG